MLGVVKHEYIRGGRLRGNDAGVLWHVPGSVHLSFMVNLQLNLYFPTD